MRNLFRIYLEKPELAGVALLVLLAAVFEARSAGAFLSGDNLRGILGLLPEVGLVSIGVTILMICGEFDLSVGSTFALTPMATSLLIIAGVPRLAAILLGLLLAAAIGFANGFITLTFAIPSFIATLGMLFIVRSLTVVVSGGFPPLLPDDLATGEFTQFVGPGGLFRASFIWFLAIAFAASTLLAKSSVGNWIKATGGHLEAASAMGVPVRRVKLFCFMLCSVMAGFRRHHSGVSSAFAASLDRRWARTPGGGRGGDWGNRAKRRCRNRAGRRRRRLVDSRHRQWTRDDAGRRQLVQARRWRPDDLRRGFQYMAAPNRAPD